MIAIMKVRCKACKKQFSVYGKKKRLKGGAMISFSELLGKEVEPNHIDHKCTPKKRGNK